MNRSEIEKLYCKNKIHILGDMVSADTPTTIMLGGQPACGKSMLTVQAIKQHNACDFLIINGDDYRIYHPNYLQLNENESFSAQSAIKITNKCMFFIIHEPDSCFFIIFAPIYY